MTDEPLPRWRVSRRLIAWVTLSVTLALLSATLVVTSQPTVCASCHAMRPYADAQTSTAHRGLACYDCHLAAGVWSWPSFKTRELFVMYPRALRGGKPSGAGTRAAGRRCLGCHEAVLARTVSGAGLRFSHKDCVPERRCDACHAAPAHGSATRWTRQPIMEDCLRCHAPRGSVRCDTCHALRSRTSLLKSSAWRVTHGPEWRLQHGMGDITLCAVCHADSDCVRCHGIPVPHPVGFWPSHGEYSRGASAKCMDCHSKAGFCDGCHGVAMPHPAGFARTHGTVATSKTDKRCGRCHILADCAACHATHKHPVITGSPMTGTLLPGVRKP